MIIIPIQQYNHKSIVSALLKAKMIGSSNKMVVVIGLCFCLLVAAVVVESYITPTTTTSATTSINRLSSSQIHSTNNPFFASSTELQPPTPAAVAAASIDQFDPTPETLIAKARVILATDLGIQDPSLLDPDFIHIRPLAEKPLGKVDYLAAGKFFDLRSVRCVRCLCVC